MKFDAAPSIADALESTLEAFRTGDFNRAEVEAEAALSIDFEHPGIQSALKCAVFWRDKFARAEALSAPETKADYLLKEWSGFEHRFSGHLDEPFTEGLAVLKGTVFHCVAEAYLEQVAFEDESRHHELLTKTARTWKRIGSFDRALESLDRVLQVRPDDAGALAEMADCLEVVGDSQKSKLFFREAFYLNPQAVDLDQLLSFPLNGVVNHLREKGVTGVELNEWIPVYAVVGGVFNVKRDLKPLELGQLKQGINALKSELHGGGARPIGLPRLLNRYFWLIDHFFSVKEDRSKIEDVLLNIKLLDQEIYELYTH